MAWQLVTHPVIHRPHDPPHVLLGHSQAQLLLGLPQCSMHHVLVSRVTFAAWETEQAQGVWSLGSWRGRGISSGRRLVTLVSIGLCH